MARSSRSPSSPSTASARSIASRADSGPTAQSEVRAYAMSERASWSGSSCSPDIATASFALASEASKWFSR